MEPGTTRMFRTLLIPVNRYRNIRSNTNTENSRSSLMNTENHRTIEVVLQ